MREAAIAPGLGRVGEPNHPVVRVRVRVRVRVPVPVLVLADE